MTTQTIHITKPELVGSEKQIKWANDIINNIISILGEIEIPAGATEDQIAQVQKIIDTFFGKIKRLDRALLTIYISNTKENSIHSSYGWLVRFCRWKNGLP